MEKSFAQAKFCSLETKIGQLNRIIEEKESFEKKLCFSLITLQQPTNDNAVYKLKLFIILLLLT